MQHKRTKSRCVAKPPGCFFHACSCVLVHFGWALVGLWKAFVRPHQVLTHLPHSLMISSVTHTRSEQKLQH